VTVSAHVKVGVVYVGATITKAAVPI
jgi:hypothetical protein